MKYFSFLLAGLFLVAKLNAQTALSELPKEMFGSENTAMTVQKTKAKKKPKSLGDHGVKLEDSKNPDVENAITMLNEGKVTEAESEFDKVDEVDPAAAFGLASAHYLDGKLDQALRVLAKLPQNDPDVRYLKGLIFTDQGNYDIAEEIFMGLIEEDPKDVDSWDALGWLYYSAGLDEPAEECRKAIMEIDPNYEMSY